MPPAWKTLQESDLVKQDAECERLVRDLSVVFGDGRALDSLVAIAADHSADPAGRRDALRVLVEARATNLVPLLVKMADERQPRDRRRARHGRLRRRLDPQLSTDQLSEAEGAGPRGHGHHARLAPRLGAATTGRRGCRGHRPWAGAGVSSATNGCLSR